MKVLVVCLLILFTLHETEAEGCFSRKKRPANTLVTCMYDRTADRYKHCRYVCREGYYFRTLVEEEVQLCVNGSWIPEEVEGCISQTNDGKNRNSCTWHPTHPRNSHSSCSLDRRLLEYKSCAYFCAKRFYFYGKVAHLVGTCVNGTWTPNEIGDCTHEAEIQSPCQWRPKRPKNSFSTCRFDQKLGGYTSCTYTCKTKYYFHGEINEKTQVCANGEWVPETLGDCVNETERYSPIALACFVTPPVPKKSSVWCNFDENLGEYTECIYTCTTGNHFEGMVSEKKRSCVYGQWIPEYIEDCSDQIKRYAVGVGPCSSRPYLPKDSFVSCTIERRPVTRRTCTYVCREGYVFSSKKNKQIQYCVNDTWTPSDFGHCVGPASNLDSMQRACSSVPAKRPKNALIYFSYNGSVSGFTDTKYVCFVGYSFYGDVNEKTQFCADGRWIPEEVGDCT